MAGKPKPGFWIVLIIVIAGLLGFALYRAGIVFNENTLSKAINSEPKESLQKSNSKEQKVVEITFYSSSAKKNWIDEMVETFNKSRIGTEDNIIRVKTFHVTSGESLDQLKAGEIQPDIWSPGDESWLQLAESHWKNVKQKSLYDTYQPLVNIPLVIAIWEPMAKALGYPEPIGWKDIAKVAANPDGWAAYGHPEWAKFRWGHAHPDANSGFLTIISEVYAAAGKTEGILPEDLKKPEVMTFLKEFEGAVEHYGLSNSWIDEVMHRKGPGYLSATVQYENTIIQTNEANQNKPFKLVAIYPTEGNFWTQHPAAILKEDWMNPEKEAACRKFIDFLLSKEAQSRAMQMGLRPIREDIAISMPFDSEHGVQVDINLTKKFQVPSEGVLKRIRDLWENVKVPATIIMVLDHSGSMKGDPIDNAKIGGIEFIKSMKPRDQLTVIVFNNTVTTLSESCYISDCGEASINRLGGIFAEGGTALYDATFKAYQTMAALKKREPNRRYSILLLSDGKDTSSTSNLHDFMDSLPTGEDYDAPKIFAIAYGSEADTDLLTEISNRTNGRVFSSNPKDIAKTYKELSANF